MAFITQRMWLLSVAFISKRTKGKLRISWAKSHSPETHLCAYSSGWEGLSPCAAAFGSQPSLLQCLSVLMCVGCQRSPGLPGWGLLGLVQRGLRAPSQVELIWGRRSSQSHPGVGTCSCLMPFKAASQELGNTNPPASRSHGRGSHIFLPRRQSHLEVGPEFQALR